MMAVKFYRTIDHLGIAPGALAWAIVAVAVLLAIAPAAYGQNAQSLAQTSKIYVAPFTGSEPAADQLRRNVIKRLRKSGRFQVVDTPETADATLAGTGQIWTKGYLTTNWRAPSTNRQAVFGGYLSSQITGEAGRTLWSYLVTPGKLIWSNITDDLAANLVKNLVDAVSHQAPLADSQQSNLSQATLDGAGATFPAPLYQKWFQSFQQRHPTVQITYHGVGSEKGIDLLADGKINFAGSDIPTQDADNRGLPGNFLRIATVLGAVVPIYNLSDATVDLKFTPEILANIYLGTIKRWDDPQIRRWNKDANLPDSDIVVMHRSDGSGTTYAWSDFLTKVSADWKSSVGTGARLKWPVGTGAEGNEGVAAAVQATPDSIGYVELVYAIQHQLTFGLVRNHSGEFIRAGLDTLSAAAKSTTSDAQTPSSITDSPAKGAYPIATFTWLLFPREPADTARKNAELELLRWILTDGQNECSALAYAPLPKEVVDRQLELLKSSW